jgi:surface polysaccharide O-acyltransferase-like enzyme
LSRIKSVDVFRLFAITAVIASHTQLFRGWLSFDAGISIRKYLSVLIDQTERFSVPFFFVISGYFWGAKVNGTGSVVSVSIPMAKKIFLVFAVWSIVYLVPYNNLMAMTEFGLWGPIKVIYWHLKTFDPITLIMEGTKVHLWFLVALLFSIGISAILVEKKCYKTLIALSAALYLIGLLAKSYSNTPFGLHINFNTRNGPFYGTIFFVTGYFLSNLTPNSGWFSKGITLFCLGLLLQFSETYVLWKSYHTSPHQAFVIGTYFMGVGSAVASLSNNSFFEKVSLADFGKFTLGIYAIHYAFVELLEPIRKFTSSTFWEIGYTMLVLLCSLASVMLLSRGNITRRIVS